MVVCPRGFAAALLASPRNPLTCPVTGDVYCGLCLLKETWMLLLFRASSSCVHPTPET